MELTNIIFLQLGNMALLILFGFILVKINVLDENGYSQIGSMLVKFILPIVLFLGFQEEFSRDRFISLIWAVLLSVLLHIVRIGINHLAFKKEDAVDKFAAVFTNSGFIGVPLVQALFGYEGIFYVSVYVVVSAIFQWTYGVYELSKDKNSIKLKNALLNPASIGAGLGFIMYLLPLQLPTLFNTTLTNIASLNTVLGMMLVGAYIAKEKLTNIFKNKKIYKTSLIISVLHPVIGILILWLLPIEDPHLIFALFVANSAPTAVNTAIFAQLYGEDYQYGANIILVSTLVSILVIPVLLQVVTIIL